MTLHDREWTNPAQPSEVFMPYSLARVLVLGLLALSFAVAGVRFEFWRRSK